MTHVILLGPPGAGKGTQASFMMRRYNLAKLSTGDMLREACASDSPVGKQLKATMASGALVEDSVMIEMIRERITANDCTNGFILDGFPRTQAQAEALDVMLDEENKTLDYVIELAVNNEELVERISGRYACAECGEGYHDNFKPAINGVCQICGSSDFTRREDDNASTVSKRLQAYHEQTAPLLPYYKKKHKLQTVDGMLPMQDVTNQIIDIIK